MLEDQLQHYHFREILRFHKLKSFLRICSSFVSIQYNMYMSVECNFSSWYKVGSILHVARTAQFEDIFGCAHRGHKVYAVFCEFWYH
jgi:hypothetical protein